MAICRPCPVTCRNRTGQFAEGATPLFAAGVTPIFLGGDHSVTLPLLRAAAAEHGPLALLHFDSHSDLWDGYFGGLDTHGTPMRRALEEGLIDPAHSIQVGLRGPVYDEADRQLPASLGFEVISGPALHERGIDAALRQIRARLGGRPAYLSFDIDFVDPAYAPGTGTPETDGFSGPQCHRLLRGLRGLPFVAYDLVEVMPVYDPAGVTSLLAANLVYEFIALIALQRRAEGGASTVTVASGAVEPAPETPPARETINLLYGHPHPTLLPAPEMRAATLAMADELLLESQPRHCCPAIWLHARRGGAAAAAARANWRARRAGNPAGRADDHGRRHAGPGLRRHHFSPLRSAACWSKRPAIAMPCTSCATSAGRCTPVPLTENGIDAAALAAECERLQREGRPPSLLYTVPTFHNPAGVTASEARRAEVLALSQRYGFRIVEDEAYRELYFEEPPPPSYYELAQRAGIQNGVIRLGSFSKTLAPGLRLGWLMASAEDQALCQYCGAQCMAGGASPFAIQAVARLLARGDWAPHMARLRRQYRARRDVMLAALAESMPADAQWSRPGGGFFIWLTAPPGVAAGPLRQAARARGVTFAPGTDFDPAPAPADARVSLRLSFSFASEDGIRRGIRAPGGGDRRRALVFDLDRPDWVAPFWREDAAAIARRQARQIALSVEAGIDAISAGRQLRGQGEAPAFALA